MREFNKHVCAVVTDVSVIIILILSSTTATRYHTRDMVSINITLLFFTIASCSDTSDIPPSLLQQLRIYHQKQEKDNRLADIPGGVDLNNHNDVYRLVFEKVCPV